MPQRDSKFRGLIGVPQPLPDDDEEGPGAGFDLIPTTTAPQRSASARRHPSRRGRADPRAAITWARQSSKREPRAWPDYTAQVPDVLSARLARRLVLDEETRGDPRFPLGILHYLSAAYGTIPLAPLEAWFPPQDPLELAGWQPPEAARWALAWRARSIGHRRLVRSGSALHQDVARAMHELPRRLKLLPDPVLAWEVQAEALARLLDALDAEKGGLS